MSDEKRSYQKRKRAELEEKTHLKITESAMALHGTVGPSKTTVSAIADHAGVRRSTVYRHFPDEAAIFGACSSHWMSLHPLPDPAKWAAINDLESRRRTVFNDLYAYFRSGEKMLHNILRDEEDLPALKAVLVGYHGYLDQVKGQLQSEASKQNPVTGAVIGHALNFFTWRSLAMDQGLSDQECAELMCGLVGIAEGSNR